MLSSIYKHKGKIVVGATVVGGLAYWYFSDTSNNNHAPDTIKPPNAFDPEVNNYFKNKDGLWIYTRSWLPKEKSVEALVFIIHGLGEHCNRDGYHDLASTLTKAGYAVFSMDHQGHGKSNGSRGHVKDFSDYCDDLEHFVRSVKSHYADIPVFGVGHSMGGAILLLTVIQHKQLFDGMILSSPACCTHADPRYSETLQKVGKQIHRVFPKAKLVHIPGDKISRNRDACVKYQKDPLVYHGLFPASSICGIQKTSEILWNRFNEISIPFIVLHGTADDIVHPNSAKHLFDKAASKDKEILLLDGVYHEVWEDPERTPVFEKLVQWLNLHLKNS